MTEREELEQELSSFLVGKLVSISHTNWKGEEQTDADMVDRLAIDADTRKREYLIFFLNNDRRVEIPLDDFYTKVTLL
jgi:hypothetical protein